MCGIAGYCDFNKKSDIQILSNMINTLDHRGPDDTGILFWENQNANIGFGHKRLSVIDLSNAGHQPMLSICKRYAIVFNGEIYNYKEIKEELLKEGCVFSSNSDTEVVLNSYIKWGSNAVSKFIGMFAYSIYDIENQEIIIVRDRAGVKPLYYYWSKDNFLFASELKAFHQNPCFKKEININSLETFLKYGYTLTPSTIFTDTYKLKPGHYIKLDLKKKSIEELEYWNVAFYYNRPKLNISLQESIEETEKLLKSAFQYRMVADVPVGVFLSGGYDSSAVTAILQANKIQKLKTFSIGFYEKKFNEANFARNVAEHLHTDHTEYYCTQKDAIDIIPNIANIFDEPFADSSAIPTILVSKLAREQVTVSLSADGGDEIFAGYDKYHMLVEYYKKINKFPPTIKHLLLQVLKVIQPLAFSNQSNFTVTANRIFKIIETLKEKNDIIAYLKIINQHVYGTELDELLLTKHNSTTVLSSYEDTIDSAFNDPLNKILAIDYKTYMLDDILTKVDRATMSVSLEGREPLLDHRIIEFVAQLPSQYKIYNDCPKYILKQIVHKYIPKDIMERPKMGFGIPIEIWLKNELRELLDYYLEPQKISAQGIFNTREIISLKNNYLKNKKVNVRKLWFILVFQMWYERWM